jgi:hypothetical protein
MAAAEQRDAAEPNCTKGHVTYPTLPYPDKL